MKVSVRPSCGGEVGEPPHAPVDLVHLGLEALQEGAHLALFDAVLGADGLEGAVGDDLGIHADEVQFPAPLADVHRVAQHAQQLVHGQRVLLDAAQVAEHRGPLVGHLLVLLGPVLEHVLHLGAEPRQPRLDLGVVGDGDRARVDAAVDHDVVEARARTGTAGTPRRTWCRAASGAPRHPSASTAGCCAAGRGTRACRHPQRGRPARAATRPFPRRRGRWRLRRTCFPLVDGMMSPHARATCR